MNTWRQACGECNHDRRFFLYSYHCPWPLLDNPLLSYRRRVSPWVAISFLVSRGDVVEKCSWNDHGSTKHDGEPERIFFYLTFKIIQANCLRTCRRIIASTLFTVSFLADFWNTKSTPICLSLSSNSPKVWESSSLIFWWSASKFSSSVVISRCRASISSIVVLQEINLLM